MSALYEAMKRMANEFDQNREATSLCFGTVKVAKPLTIELDNKLVLEEKYFVLAQHLTNYEIECEIETEEVEGFYVEHEGRHDAQTDGGWQMGKILMKNELNAGERVIVVRMDGGQMFAVLDRIGEKP